MTLRCPSFANEMSSEIKPLLFANIAIALVLGVGLYVTRSEQEAIVASLTALIAFSPFNLILGSTLVNKRAARLLGDIGIELRSMAALLKLCSIDTVAFSLNRMITTGEYFITDLYPIGMTQAGLLSTAAAAERDSTHPLGRKIFETAEGRCVLIEEASMSNEVEGNGIEALVNGLTVRVGRPAWVISEGVKLNVELRTKIDQIAAKCRTPLVVTVGRIARGLIGLKDEVDERAPIFLDRLKYNGLETVLLTAEPKKKANAMIKGLKVDAARAELLPEEKAREIQLMQARGKVVAMMSSEEKDRPAFEAADVSIMIGEVETDAADFVLDDWGKFFELRKSAFEAKKILRWNRRIVLATWALMAVLTLKMVIGEVPMPPLLATVGILIGAALVVWNSRRMI